MSSPTGVVKLNILNPGFIQSQSYTLSSLPSSATLENVELCYICNTEIEEGIIETVFSTDEIVLHKIITETLNIELTPETKILDRLCKSCISHLEEYQDLLSRLGNVKALLQLSYKKGQETSSVKQNNPDFTLLKNAECGTTYLIYETKESDGTVPQLYISDARDKMLEIIDDQGENLDEFVQLGAIADVNPQTLFARQDQSENYFCKQCSDSNAIIYDCEAIQLHLLTEHGYALFICTLCDACFNDRTELNLHKIESHSDVPPLVPLSKGFRCLKCDKIFTQKCSLDDHTALLHADPRPFKCSHEGCTKDFTSKYTLASHMKIHTDRPRPYKCNICEKSFYHSQNLVQHRKLHAINAKEFVCPSCNKTFSTQHNLDVHFIVHTKVKKFGCNICNKMFARKAEVRDHERTHSGEKPFGCDMCHATFAQRSNLLSHKRATHLNDKRHKCTLCNRGFKRRRLLDYHIKSTHTFERPFSCEICNATFVIPEHFKKHMRIHSGKKPFNCELCKRSFSSKDNLKAHRFVHSKQKPYECVVCEMGFMRKTLLFTHMQSLGHESDHFIINEPKVSNDGTIEIEKTLVRIEIQRDDNPI